MQQSQILIKLLSFTDVGQMRNAHRILVGIPEDKRLSGALTREDDIETDLEEVKYEDVDCIHLVQHRKQ
jgi:hypothetical protein